MAEPSTPERHDPSATARDLPAEGDTSITDPVWTGPVACENREGNHDQEARAHRSARCGRGTRTRTSADAATEPFGSIQLASRPAILHADGNVDVVMWARCKPGINAFELDTGVVQSKFAASGQDVRVEAGVVPCDGTRHRVVVNVSPFEGAFRPTGSPRCRCSSGSTTARPTPTRRRPIRSTSN